jgi:hypothetical protein
MSLPTLEQLLGTKTIKRTLLPEGKYSGVITGAEVNKGPKGPYIAVEVTIHDEGSRGRKVWGNASFSEGALGYPGASPNLVQAAQPVLDESMTVEQLPEAVANGILTLPIRVEVGHDQVKRGGKLAFTDEGDADMRASVTEYFEADAEFIEQLEAEAEGIDDDLPF